MDEKLWPKAVKSPQAHQGTCIFKSSEVLVNTQCLLELFQYCWLCQIKCCITIEGHERQFSIFQDCQSCGHHKEWRSHPSPTADQHVETLNKQHRDQEKVFHEEHENDASDPRAECKQEPGDEDSEEVVIQIVSSDNEGTEQNCEMFIKKDGSYIPKAKEKMSNWEEVVKNNHGKRTSQRHKSLDDVVVDPEIIKEEDQFIVRGLKKTNMGESESERQDELDKVASGSDVLMDGLFIVEVVEKMNRGKRASEVQEGLDNVAGRSKVSMDKGLITLGEVEKMNVVKGEDNLDKRAADSDTSMDEDLWTVEDDEKKKTVEKSSERQDRSDEREPNLHEEPADLDVPIDENHFSALTEDDQGTVIVWCVVCRTDATFFCSLHCHKKVFACSQCSACDQKETHSFEKLVHFKDFPSFQKHAEKEHRAKPFHKLCPECGKVVLSEPKSRGWKDHICEKSKPIVCPECGKRFLTEVGLKRHFSKLHKDADHPCKYCLKLFKNRPSKLEHEQTHPKEKQPYSCPDCPERFDNIYKRNSHLKLHRGPYKYSCDICGKRFRDIIMLKRHKLIHSGEKPFRCQVCDRSFNQIGNLTSHMRLHTGEKPYMCEQCGECFNHNVSLKNHLMRYHQVDSLTWIETERWCTEQGAV